MKIIGFAQLRNELSKGNLTNWFRCMVPICDHIYIFDQNSNDGSLDYYAQFENVIVIASSENRFYEECICKNELLWNIKVDHPDTDWIFWMDGDTILDGRLLKDSNFRDLCNSLDDDIDGCIFGHKNLWRNHIECRTDEEFSWLDNNGVCALWRFNKDLKFPEEKGLHLRHSPVPMKKVKRGCYSLVHLGFSTDDQIIERYNNYKKYGMKWSELEMLLDETNIILEKLSDYYYPKWFKKKDLISSFDKKSIKEIFYNIS